MTQLMRWSGSKARFVARIAIQMRVPITSYSEPFVGGGSLMLHLIEDGHTVPGAQVSVSDTPPVVNLWQCVGDKETRTEVIHLLKTVGVGNTTGEVYALAKDSLGLESKTNACRAACVLILNALCFNGLWRVNKKGEFNTTRDKSKGWKPGPIIARVEAVGRLLDRVTFKACAHPWDDPIWSAQTIYVDPPYIDTFSSYDPNGFDLDDHRSLKALCETLPRGRKVIVSNSDTPKTHELYSDERWDKIQILRDNRITCDAATRGAQKAELLMVRR